MFSYRHGFHAGNHADVLKHITLIHLLEYLQKKEVGMTLVDTHAGAGLYSLNEGFAKISLEAETGIQRLFQEPDNPLLKNYLGCIRNVNSKNSVSAYPGSPFIMAQFLRPQDRLKLFELHPSEIHELERNMAQLNNHQQIEIRYENSFTQLKSVLPPPTRRGLILIDPSFEDKLDYRHIETMLSEALDRFATGCYLIWYPVLSRLESAQFPKRIKNIITASSKNWVQAELRITKQASQKRLQASGVIVINPPFTLHEYLAKTLPVLKGLLGEDGDASYHLEQRNA
ncbi:MAG: 23S rRNA (adenine(2030)-N(6))-methyltransferase RlmJ [Polynucleobacter sp.]|jgi:23S rRNA (adenine2030-N6)-methyltransferase|nr:23S rRNA (adenine(2030)-N(6))-methyltransferase RlmJ [Polynucleobacter sp.]